MKISMAEVEHVARLARLELTPEEKEKFTHQLNDILEFAAKLQAIDTEGVPPTSHVLNLKNVWREDEVHDWLTQDEALANAPAASDGCFQVPRIIED
ncbi:MAG: aspartyl-tRNA(Asn)/glutamyl-tRNA(Gln) amidotransferase subunit [Bacillota bacterium]|jgi:aspartyl-tRNA(Asn)/glutamyl-tRNA(Gln) amidotransferase subunit C|nr:aspartyl-tRNA(Asn)/glutamyl-tRNA(Gln) amidotransferase subunit [Bacillota bacterium]